MKQSGIDWIGEIPDDWKIEKFGHVLKERNEKNNPIISTERLSVSIDIGVTLYSDKTTNLDRFKDDFSQYKIAHEGDLVMNSMNVIVGSEGISPYFGCVSPAYYTYYCDDEDFNSARYCDYLFKTKSLKKFLRAIGKGIYAIDRGDDKVNTCRLKVSRMDMKNLLIPLPPKATQQRIAEYLDSKCAQIDSIIEESKKSIEEYKAWKQSVIFEAVTGKVKGGKGEVKMKNSGVEWIGEIPEDWKVVKLRNIGRCQNGISKGSEFFGKGTPFVSYGDVYRNMALSENVTGLIQSTDEEKFRYSVKRGDIFFTRTSETIEEVGIASVCLKTINNACFAGFLIRVRPFNNMIIPEFAKYYFRNIRLRDYFAKEMTLVTRASLSQNLLKELPVVVPPLTSQLSLITFLDSKCAQIDSLIAEKELLIADLTEYKKSLIFEVVTGKRSV